MFKGMAADLAGTADVCHIIHQFSKCQAAEYLLPNESIMFSLQSKKEEFTFTDQAFLKLEGENATTTRKMVTRYDYKEYEIHRLQFETAGRADRDCEIKFHVGKESISIDIAKAEESGAKDIYKVLIILSRQQKHNNTAWSHSTAALTHASGALRLTEGQLTKLADDTLMWLQVAYNNTQPRSYGEVIQRAFQDLRIVGKMGSEKFP